MTANQFSSCYRFSLLASMRSHIPRQWHASALLWLLAAIVASTGGAGRHVSDSPTSPVTGTHGELFSGPAHEVHEEPFLSDVTSRRLQQGPPADPPPPPPVTLPTAGSVIAWGNNTDIEGVYRGQASVPSFIAALTNVRGVAAGEAHSLVLLDTGQVLAWGMNLHKQTNVPPLLANVSSIAAGSNFSVAVLSDGTVTVWGADGDGRVAVPPGLTSVKRVAAGCSHILALLSDGTVRAWGSNTFSQIDVPVGLVDVLEVAASCTTSAAVLRNGTVLIWGSTAQNQANIPQAANANVVSVALGTSHVLALLRDSSLLAWGNGTEGQLDVPQGSNYVDIACRSSLSLARTSAGETVAWGSSNAAVTTVPERVLSGTIAIAAGERHVMAIVAAVAPPPPSPALGKVLAWGSNQDPWDTYRGQATVPSEIAALSNVVAVAAGYAHNLVLLDTGKVLAWGMNINNQTNVPDNLSDVVSIAAGSNFSVAVLSDGTVTTWGYNSKDGETIIPPVLTGVKQVAAGFWHTLALLDDGTVRAWGYDGYNQISVPAGLEGVTMVAAGGSFSLALTDTGKVVAWGSTVYNESSVPPEAQSGVVSIAAGSAHALAVLSDGTVVTWGDLSADDNRMNVPAGLSGCVEAAGGFVHSLARKSSGEVVVWGWDILNLLALPAEARTQSIAISAGFLHSLAIVPTGSPSLLQPSPLPPSPLSPMPAPPTPLSSPSPTLPSPPLPSPPLQPPPAPPPPPAASTGIQQQPPQPLQSLQSDESSPSPPKVGVIVGATVAGVTAVAALALLGWWLARRHKRKSTTRDPEGIQLAPSDGLLPSEPKESTSGTRSGTGSGARMGQSVSLDRRASEAIDETLVHQAVTLRTIKILWESITIPEGPPLGRGGFGTVRKGTWQGNAVAVKMLNLETLSASAKGELRKEALAMCDLRHPCIAQIYGLVDDGVHTALVMRYYKRGTVAAVVQAPDYYKFDMGQRLRMALQIASGMCFLHSRQLLHGDLKTSNLLVEDTGHGVVLADFGLSSVAGQAVASGALTVSISPPEVLQDPTAPRTQAGDVYAFAMVLLEVVDGRVPYKSMKSHQVKDCVCRGLRPTIPDDVPPGVAAIISACWAQEASSRPTFEAIMKMLETEAAGGALDQENRHPHHGGQNTTTTRPTFTLTDLTASRF